MSYYTIISKYCGNRDSAATRTEDHLHGSNDEVGDGNQNRSIHEPWHVPTAGLDEALIKTITVCKYKKGDGLVEGTDCSVCLSEFEEDEGIRLLPKCSHAFHLPCIDTWLKSHSNCPLCRANIIVSLNIASSSPLPLPAPVTEVPSSNEAFSGTQQQANENADLERGVVVEEETMQSTDVFPISKTPFRAFSDLGNSEERDTIIEIRDEGCHQHIRRSFSMSFSCQSHLSVADILRMNQDEDDQVEESCPSDISGSSKQSVGGEIGKSSSSHKKRVLHSATSPVAMKRSFSSGRFLLTRHGRRRHSVIPL